MGFWMMLLLFLLGVFLGIWSYLNRKKQNGSIVLASGICGCLCIIASIWLDWPK